VHAHNNGKASPPVANSSMSHFALHGISQESGDDDSLYL
jgi:hypothetical protein